MKKSFFILFPLILLAILTSVLVSNNNKLSFIELLNVQQVDYLTTEQSLESSDWYSQVVKKIQSDEYNISYSESWATYQSPNRAQNLRFIYSTNGFIVKPRSTRIAIFDEMDLTLREDEKKYKEFKDWSIEFSTIGYGRGTRLENYFIPQKYSIEENTGFIEDGNMKIEYINNKDGMRQNFIIKDKPEGKGQLSIKIKIETEEQMIVGANNLLFKDENGDKLQYKDLKVWDALDRELDAYFKKIDNDYIAIVVKDENALYPIMIDPLSTNPDWTTESNQAYAEYGYSVCTAGDINGDGYSDVIIGAPFYNNGNIDEGMVFVYYGSSTGISNTADWTAESNADNVLFGISVSSAGDVNCDGYSDVIIGGNHYSNGENNEGGAFVYHGSELGLSTNPDWTSESNQQNAFLGGSVSTAGDVNGDGYSDVIVGAFFYDNDQTDEGRAFVYYGSSSGLSTTTDWTAEGDQESALFGVSVSTSGDVNGDGYSDIIVGSYWYDNGQTNEGRAFVYYGSSTGLSTTADWTVESDQADAEFGVSVSTAGDVNGDGYSDVIIGAHQYSNVESKEGAAFVYHGSETGISTTADWTAESNQENASFGCSVSIAGDINGDGYSDVIVGAYKYDNPEIDEGGVFVYKGSSSGLSSIEVWTSESNHNSTYYGYSVSSAGDINGDGYSDVIIGARNLTNGEFEEGGAFVYHGSLTGLSIISNWNCEGNQVNAYFGNSVSSAGDVNGDGYSDVIVSSNCYDNGETDVGRAFVYYGSESGLSTNANWIAESNQTNARFGSSVSSAGDVNGDGYSDVIVGANCYDNGETDEGRAFVYYGSESGLSTNADWIAESNQNNTSFSTSVSSAGDVNADGYSDVIIGAPYYTNGQDVEGRVFVYYGSASGLSTNADWTSESNQDYAWFGFSVSTAGDVNGDGYSDVIIGACQYDNSQIDEGRVFVYYGSASGLSTNADWTSESNQDGAYYGLRVSTAGDVNGDGYSDVIIGAPYYSNGNSAEGSAFVYYGSDLGFSTNADWTAEINQDNAYFGYSVSTAGDVNADGYSDVIVGAYKYDNPETDEGRVFVYQGSSSGLTTEYWASESNQNNASYGNSVSRAGDVNGDGYSDIIIGADQYDNGQTNEGRTLVFYGNEGGLSLRPIQMNPKNSIIYIGDKISEKIIISMFGRTIIGRNQVRLQVEIKELTEEFNGTELLESAWDETGGTLGAKTLRCNYVPPTDNLYKWRARLEYPLSKSNIKFSRWIFYDQPNELDFHTLGSNIPLYLNLKIFLQGAYR